MLSMVSISSANTLFSFMSLLSFSHDTQITMKPLQCQNILQALGSRDLYLKFCSVSRPYFIFIDTVYTQQMLSSPYLFGCGCNNIHLSDGLPHNITIIQSTSETKYALQVNLGQHPPKQTCNKF